MDDWCLTLQSLAHERIQTELTASLLDALPRLQEVCSLHHCLDEALEAAVPRAYPATTAFAAAMALLWLGAGVVALASRGAAGK